MPKKVELAESVFCRWFTGSWHPPVGHFELVAARVSSTEHSMVVWDKPLPYRDGVAITIWMDHSSFHVCNFHTQCGQWYIFLSFSFSQTQSRNLQLQCDQVCTHRSEDSLTLKSKSRTKHRKSPYQLSNHQSQTRTQLAPTTNLTPTSVMSQPIKTNAWNNYLTSRELLFPAEQSPGGSSHSCHGENSLVEHPSHENSPAVREDYSLPTSYWKPRSNCLFGAFDTGVQHEDLYKAAYGSYYQQLAASAARTYSHMTHQSRLADLYHYNPYPVIPVVKQ